MSGDIGPKCIESFWDRNSESHRVLQFPGQQGKPVCLSKHIDTGPSLYVCFLPFLKSLTQKTKNRCNNTLSRRFGKYSFEIHHWIIKPKYILKTFCYQKFVHNTQQCFACTPQANFPAHNLNFHRRWRWWDWNHATF